MHFIADADVRWNGSHRLNLEVDDVH